MAGVAKEEMEATGEMAAADLQVKMVIMAARAGKLHLVRTVEKLAKLRYRSMRTIWTFSCSLGTLRSRAAREVSQVSMEKVARGAQEDSVMMTTWPDSMERTVSLGMQLFILELMAKMEPAPTLFLRQME